MHAKIIQVEKEPIDKENWIAEEDCWNYFLHTEIADYVDDEVTETEREAILNSFAKQIPFCKTEEGFVIKNKGFYYSDMYMQLSSIMKNINTCEDMRKSIYDLREIVNYGNSAIYIFEYGKGFSTLQDFINRALEGEEYYFGAVLDYHY